MKKYSKKKFKNKNEKPSGKSLKNIGKVFLLTCSFSAIGNGAFAQESVCETDPDYYTDYVVAGNFTGVNFTHPDDVVMISNNGLFDPAIAPSIDMLINVSGSTPQLIKSLNVIPSMSGYDLTKVNGRMIGGDFDNDEQKDDFILLYKEAAYTMRFDLFESNGTSTTINRSEFYTQTGYNADKITGRVVSGDFDDDGYWDDIAAFYDYGDGETRIHLWTSDGTTMNYQGEFGWWNTFGYTANKITDRVVSGDFDRDGDPDDIAAFYDYGAGETRIHVWTGNGSSFDYQGAAGWFSSVGYWSDKITGRVVSVNINKDSKFYDDIAVFYDYGGGETIMHTFVSDGGSFAYDGPVGPWTGSIYNADMITGRVVAVEADNTYNEDGISDVLAFYDYGPLTNKYHMWKGGEVGGEVDIYYNHYKFCPWKKKSRMNEQSDIVIGDDRKIQIKQYPNPTNEYLFYELGENIVTEILITDMQGQTVMKQAVSNKNGKIEVSNLEHGTYLCIYLNDAGIVEQQKITIVD